MKAENTSCDTLPKSSIDLAVLTQISSQGGRLSEVEWNCENPRRLTYLSISNMVGSLNVSGCSALRYLNCFKNQLTSLDVSGCSALLGLYCNEENINITSLDASGCTALTILRCNHSQLTNLNIKGCIALAELYCQSNQLTDLDASGCTALTKLRCEYNQLNSLDVSGCSTLEYLYCFANQLTSIDVRGCSALKYLDCYANQLTSLDVNGCYALIELNCGNNQLTNFDVNNCTSLKIFRFIDNPLISLNINTCTSLRELSYTNKQLTSLNVNGCTALTKLDCYKNKLINLSIKGCTALTELNCSYNLLTNLDVSGCTSLVNLFCNSNDLINLDASGCTDLYWISLDDNQLTSLNVNGCSDLPYLNCNNNQLTNLDVSGCSTLTTLSCDDNQLTNLDVSGCSTLTTLRCDDNQLTNLDVSGCSALAYLYCNNNQLTSLDISKNTALTTLSCSINRLTELNLKNGHNSILVSMSALNNSSLFCIKVDDPSAASSYLFWSKDDWATYSLDCFNKPFSYENNWTVSKTPGMPEHPIGVVADGCSAIKINLTQNDKSITVEDVGIRVFDINNEYIPTGNIGTSISQATAPYLLENLSYLPDAIFYVAPDMVSYDILYKNEWNRKVVVQISINNSDYVLNDTINIIRPPVLLIHGLNSTSDCFRELQNELIGTGRYADQQAFCVDYSTTNQAFFEENSHVVPYNIELIKECWRIKGYANSKVDIVGHSMGGILSRLYLQSSGYDNNIHKLITLNTPHSGSQGANILVLFPEIRKRIKLEGNAVNDLCVTSFATRTLLNGSSVLNRNKVPSYAIATKTSVFSKAVRSDKLGVGMFLAFSVLCPSLSVGINSVPSLIYHGENDLVVAVNSQEGGLRSSTLVDNEWHSSSNNPTVKSIITELLMLPSTDATFSTQGFNPPTLESGETFTEIVASLKSSIINNDSVYFKLPTNDVTISSGDSITIEVARTANVKNLIFMAMESQDSVYLKDTTATSMSFMYHVPSSCFGSIPMYVFGSDTQGNVFMDSVFVTVSPSATALSLVITYPEDSLLELSQGLKSSVRVSCLFSDSITRDITTLTDVQYSTKTGNAVVTSQGVIKGIHEGLDTLIVSYAGLKYSLPINTNQDYTCNVNASVSPDNSGNATGTGTFFYGDSVTLVATPESGYAFDYWSENGIEISNNINYSFEIYSSKNLVANFKSSTDVKNISINNNLVSIYPNPNDGNFTVNIDADYTGEVVINIFSVTGVQCDRIEFIKSANKTTHEINSKCFVNGIYFVEIIFGDERVTKKIIIN